MFTGYLQCFWWIQRCLQSQWCFICLLVCKHTICAWFQCILTCMPLNGLINAPFWLDTSFPKEVLLCMCKNTTWLKGDVQNVQWVQSFFITLQHCCLCKSRSSETECSFRPAQASIGFIVLSFDWVQFSLRKVQSSTEKTKTHSMQQCFKMSAVLSKKYSAHFWKYILLLDVESFDYWLSAVFLLKGQYFFEMKDNW